jgi:hypothetical protein
MDTQMIRTQRTAATRFTSLFGAGLALFATFASSCTSAVSSDGATLRFEGKRS